jgi:hypothetical protein
LFFREVAKLKASGNKSVSIALMMEAASTSETSVNFYQTIWRNNPEDSHFHFIMIAVKT